jgi:beta-mannanase
MRYRWEMDRPNLRATMWSPEDYIAMWRHVRALFASEGVHNASWVWCPTIEGFERGEAPAFYPGDDQVDWLCVDVYSGSRFVPLGEHLTPFFAWTASHPTKPVMIGEFGVARAYESAKRAAWIRNGAAVFKANSQVKAVLYFESDPEDRKPEGRFSISDDPAALAAFVELARDPYFNPRRP